MLKPPRKPMIINNSKLYEYSKEFFLAKRAENKPNKNDAKVLIINILSSLLIKNFPNFSKIKNLILEPNTPPKDTKIIDLIVSSESNSNPSSLIEEMRRRLS